VLSEEQVWKGLQFKGRNPKVSSPLPRAAMNLLILPLQDFVPMISHAEVIKETDEGSRVRRRLRETGAVLTALTTVHPQSRVRRKSCYQRDCPRVRAEHGKLISPPFGAEPRRSRLTTYCLFPSISPSSSFF